MGIKRFRLQVFYLPLCFFRHFAETEQDSLFSSHVVSCGKQEDVSAGDPWKVLKDMNRLDVPLQLKQRITSKLCCSNKTMAADY